MRLVVTDANIIIDLAAGDLLDEAFRLVDVEFCTPDIIYVEELADRYGVLPALGLKVVSQPAEDVHYVEVLRRRYPRPSTNDLFALALARSLNCPLLSGDRSLRIAAETEHVEVRGTLWLVDTLLRSSRINLERAVAAYAAMRKDGSRLPWDEVDAQLKRWRREEQ
jgi:predicted nucleic acid-binding protein